MNGGRILRLTRLALFCAVLALPSLTAAQTILDVSGSVPESNGTVATFSGTLTVSAQNNIVTGIESWDIQMPPIGSGSAALPALIFTPTNSSFFQSPLGSADDPTDWSWNFDACTSGSNCTLLSLGEQTNGISQALGFLPLGYFTNGQSFPVIYGNESSGNVGSASIALATTPEPSSMILVGSGLAGLVAFRRRLFAK